jgi:hypothetical protein
MLVPINNTRKDKGIGDMKQKILSFTVTALFLFFSSLPAQANHPRPDQMTNVQQLALRLRQDTAILADAARSQAHHFTDREAGAIERFDAFRDRADDFYRQVTDYYSDPARTEEAYQRLQRSYARVERAYNRLHGTRSVDLAINRMSDTMRTLSGLYEASQSNYYEQPGPVSYRELQATADRIAELAKRVHDQASYERGQSDRDRVEKALERLDEVKDAAFHFRDQVEKYHGDPGHIDEEYRELTRRINRAETDLRFFSGAVTSDFQRLSSLSNRIGYLAGGERRYQ